MRAPLSPTLFDQFARGWRGYALIALIALLASLFGAARVPVMDADEARFAQATRQMIESDDYLRIRLQDEPRNKKPIGAHWLQAISVQAFEPLTGRLNVIWPYRLPSALGVVLAALATAWGGGALVGRRIALVGAGLLATGVLVSFEGMTAKTDALLLGFTTLAIAALARLRCATLSRVNDSDDALDAGPRTFALVFWAALGCGVMIKGPVAPLVAVLTLATLALWERRVAWMKPLLWWPGPLLATLIVAPWSIAISLETGGRFFFDMFFGHLAPKLAGGHEGHFALPGFHTFLLPLLIFPASYALPAAARLGWDALAAPRGDDAHAPLRFLVAWAAPVLVFFELAPTKLAHYPMPAYPAIALLCAAGLFAMRGQPWRTAHPAGLVLFGVTGACVVALMAIVATMMPGDFGTDLRRAISAALVGVGVVAVGLVALMMLDRPAARAAALAGCALALSFSLRERLAPEARELFVSTEAVATLTRARLTPREDRPLWVIGYAEPSLIFLTRTSIRLVSAAEAGAGAQPGDAMIVEGRVLHDAALALSRRGLVFEPAEPAVRGVAMTRGERVALFVGSVREMPEVSGEPADARPRSP
ncbi:MAG: ArnT family glycosyltransferase [Vitreimonas sp.]